MPAKPVAAALGLAACLLLGGRATGDPVKKPLPAILLYPRAPADVAALVDIRSRLRIDGRLQVLTYDPDSATVVRVASEARHPEWLTAPADDDTRLALARALGVAFYAVVSPGRGGDATHIQFVETAPGAVQFDWDGVNRQFGVHAVEAEADASLARAATDSSLVASSSAPALAAPAPAAPGPSASAPSAPLPVIHIQVADAVPPVSAPDQPKTSQVAAAPPTLAAAPVPPPAVAPPQVVPAPAPPSLVTPAPAPQVAAVPAPDLRPDPAPAVEPPAVPTPAPVAAPIPVPQISDVPVQVAQARPEPTRLVLPPAPALRPAAPEMIPATPVAVPKPIPVPVSPPPAPTLPAPAPEAAGTQVAMLPPPDSRPAPDVPAPPAEEPAPVALKPPAKAEDLSAVSPLLSRGDADLETGDVVGAISLYREAINGAPTSVVPRLKLAQAYQHNGMTEKALDEARRALEIAPDSQAVQKFLSDMDELTGTSDGSVARFRAAVAYSPQDPAAHSGLAEGLWNSGDLSGAEAEFKAAQTLSAPGDHGAASHLARLYASQARYDDCLTILRGIGGGGYVAAVRIETERADTLGSTMESARGAFAAGKITREQFYDTAKQASAQAQALAAFVGQVSPPTEYKLSSLYRLQATNLLAQEAATLVTFIETGDPKQGESIPQLQKDVQTQMLTARAAEEKLGLGQKLGEVK